MPASPNTVSLDQARTWAKRLLKATPALGGLAAAQGAVAVMLGHASWHALVACHDHARNPPGGPTPAADPPTCKCGSTIAVEDHDGQPLCARCFCATEPLDEGRSAPSSRPSLEEAMDELLSAANARYPGLEATFVEVIANETDETDARPHEVLERARELEREKRMWLDEAIEQVLEDSQRTIHAPPGHIMLRVRCANGRRCMAVVPSPGPAQRAGA